LTQEGECEAAEHWYRVRMLVASQGLYRFNWELLIFRVLRYSWYSWYSWYSE
jgi:hypothetical protein